MQASRRSVNDPKITTMGIVELCSVKIEPKRICCVAPLISLLVAAR